MKLKLFLASVLAVSQVFSAEPDGRGTFCVGSFTTDGETYNWSTLEEMQTLFTQLERDETLLAETPYHEFQKGNEKLALMKLCDGNRVLSSEYCNSLANMLSSPSVMNLYLSGAHYPRDHAVALVILLVLAKKKLDSMEEKESEELDDEEKVFAKFLRSSTEEELLGMQLTGLPAFMTDQVDYSRAFCGVLFLHLLNDTGSNLGAYSALSEAFEDFIEHKDCLLKIIKDRDYQLPQKVANHLNLDLKTDGLPRFVLSAGEKVIGFMRFGAYPKAMIDEDLKGNPDALELLESNYMKGRGCAIAAIMLQEQYHGKKYGSSFWMEMFAKILPWYATNPEAPKYPEGQLGQVYVTHRAEQMVTAKLVGKLLADSRFTVIDLGPFESSNHKKMAYLVQFAEAKRAEEVTEYK